MDNINNDDEIKPKKEKKTKKEYNDKYYKKNREKIIKKMCVKINCEKCGRETTVKNLKSHMKTKLCNKLNDKDIQNNNFVDGFIVELSKNEDTEDFIKLKKILLKYKKEKNI